MYAEKIGWPPWFHLIMCLPVVGGAIGIGVLLRRDGWHWSIGVAALVIALVGLVWWRCRFIQIEISEAGAAFGFGGLGRRVPRERLVSVEPEEYSVARYMGWGYRFGWQARDRAYSVTGYRGGIRLRFLDERGREWSVFVSCTNPEEAVRAAGK